MTTVQLTPSAVFRIGHGPEAPVQLAAGEGTNRQQISCSNPAFVSWLLRLAQPTDSAAASSLASRELDLSQEDARSLVDKLMGLRVLVSPAECEAEAALRRRWENWGWRDALDFHLAARNYEFSLGDTEGYAEQDSMMSEYVACSRGSEEEQPGPYKEYPGAELLALPRARERIDAVSFGDALYRRRTRRDFSERALEFPLFAELLEHSLGVVQEREHPILGRHLLRTSPSGGARHPIEAYVVVSNVEAVTPGIYHYSMKHHALELLRRGDFRADVHALGHSQANLDRAPALVYFSARWARHQWKYRYARSYRMVLYDVAHLVQTFVLTASALGLASFLTPALDDGGVRELLGLHEDLEESPLYLSAVGHGCA
jgi:SagB-type dehydrogenase family enzyme